MANRKSPSRIFPAAVAVSATILIPVLAQAKPQCDLPESGLPELEKAERLCQAVMPDSRSRCKGFLSELAAIEEPSLDQALALAFGQVMAARIDGELRPPFGQPAETHCLDCGTCQRIRLGHSRPDWPLFSGLEVLKPFVDAAPDDPMLLKTYASFYLGLGGARVRGEDLLGGDEYMELLRRVLALDPACSSAAYRLAQNARSYLDIGRADDEEDINRYLTHGYEHSEGMWKLLFAYEKYLSLDKNAPEADAFHAQVAADVGSRHMLVDDDPAWRLEIPSWHQALLLDRTANLHLGQWAASEPDEEQNGPAEDQYLTLGYEHSPGTWELLVVLSNYESLREDDPEEAEAYRAQMAAEFESRPMPLDAGNRAQSLKVLCDGSALKLRMEARCEAAVQEVVASDRRANVPLGADVLEAIDSLNGAAERGDFGDEGARHHEYLWQLLEAEPERHRSAEFYVVYSRTLRPTAGVEAEADALRRALDLDPRSGEIGLYLTGALKRVGRTAQELIEAEADAWRRYSELDPGDHEGARPSLAEALKNPERPKQEIQGVYRHVIANADDRSAKDLLPMDHYTARATQLLRCELGPIRPTDPPRSEVE